MSRKSFSILSELLFKYKKQIENGCRSRLALVLQMVESEHIGSGMRGEKREETGKIKAVPPNSGIKIEVVITDYVVICKKGNTGTTLPCRLENH